MGLGLGAGLGVGNGSGLKFVAPPGPIASAPAASGYPAGAIVYDNVTNTAWIAVDGVWGLTDCPDVGEQTILIDENGTILIDSDYVVFVED